MPILTPKEVLARISAASVMKENATDADASRCVSVYPALKGDGSLIKVGTRIAFKGELYRARVDLWDTEENTPELVPSLWERVMYKRGYRIIPDVITAENPLMKDEVAWWGDERYVSLLDSNVWTPEQNPSGWEKLGKY